MKKTILSLVALSVLGMSSTVTAGDYETGQASFQWIGTVPAKTEASTGYQIVQSGSVGFNEGVMTFVNDTSGVKLTNANTIGFKVMDDDTGTNALKYKAELTSIKVGANDFATEQEDDGYFAVLADGEKLEIGAEITKEANANVTMLTIAAKSEDATADLEANESVVVQALLAVTPEA
ncbi:hypothetical protein [Photobacterium angustum]|uniref:hypothetical protein n=1 Tax=Photobacterium angustum TaxID=661 RepID=UPI0005DDE58E|nr:hypothetical protein [Photobacterium angustum]KJF92314.1 hypothetical protein UB39_21280 [Photobacterium angustum]KJG04073.1 hypothetical protein UB33_20940 [Photobacterium angustum]KJG16872.1 hypothetical protein UA33_12705 [Photobacterium angustum]KJG23109.1 hypothetical protein UA39_11875 [Photobacterium angustum]KJG30141.1 hypothetical protein UA36_12895 [Photobacterium angustum]